MLHVCPNCHRNFKNSQGLGGHLVFCNNINNFVNDGDGLVDFERRRLSETEPPLKRRRLSEISLAEDIVAMKSLQKEIKKNFTQRKRRNMLINQKNAEIDKKNELINEKNGELKQALAKIKKMKDMISKINETNTKANKENTRLKQELAKIKKELKKIQKICTNILV